MHGYAAFKFLLSRGCNIAFEGKREADVAPNEHEFDTRGLSEPGRIKQ